MKTSKLAILEATLSAFLDQDDIADGMYGYYGAMLHTHMAQAAAAVYDSHMDKEAFLQAEGIDLTDK